MALTLLLTPGSIYKLGKKVIGIFGCKIDYIVLDSHFRFKSTPRNMLQQNKRKTQMQKQKADSSFMRIKGKRAKDIQTLIKTERKGKYAE